MEEKRELRAVIFDLDGVLCSTDEYHFRAWSRLARELQIPFGRTENRRLLGIGRMAALDVVLGSRGGDFTPEQKAGLAARKNSYYLEELSGLSPSDAFPGAAETLAALRELGVKTAVGSSSKNAPTVLERLRLTAYFDAVAGGVDGLRTKPEPDIFLCAARRLGVSPGQCAVVEDAAAGIEAARRAGMFAVACGAEPSVALAADAKIADCREILRFFEARGGALEGAVTE